MKIWRWMLLFGLGACEPVGEDVDTPTGLGERPDITGLYRVFITEPAGCGDHPEVRADGFEGDLRVEGEPEALQFGFENGTSLVGSVTTAFTWEATGTAALEGGDLDVFLDGLAFIGDESWNLDGDMTLDLVDSTAQATTCTLTALLEAAQIPWCIRGSFIDRGWRLRCACSPA